MSELHYIVCVSGFYFFAHNPSLDCAILRPQYQMIIAKANKYLDQPQQYLNVPITPAVVLV